MIRRHIMKIIGLLITALLLVACQPTPTEEIVKNRLDGDLEAAILTEAAAPYRYEAPERWVETLEVRGRTVRIDAEVVVADAERFPVLTIARDSFDAQRCIDILTAVSGEVKDLRENEYSYDEALSDLQNAQRGHYYEHDDESGWRSYEGQEEEDIARLQQILAELGPEDTYVPLTVSNLGFPAIDRVVRLANEEQMYLWGNTFSFSVRKYRDMLIQPELWVLQGDATPGEAKHALENIIISEEEAITEADAIIAALGRNDFQLALAEKARAIEDYSYASHGEGYLLTYVSCTEGSYPVDHSNFGHGQLPFSLSPDTYVAAWRQERISMFITEDGLLYFGWQDPKTVVNTANENAVLLPFDEIQNCIRELLSMGLRVDDSSVENDALITRVALGAAIQQIPNQGDEAFLVPAWVITYNTNTGKRLFMTDSVFMINALDGLNISSWTDWGD